MAKQGRVVVFLALAFVLLGVGIGTEGMRLWEARMLNRAAQNGEIASAEGDLPLEALFSKAYWLKRYGRFDSAAQKYNELRDRGDSGFRSGLHYNLGNVYLGQGVATRKGSFILLAEESYRDALAADPGAGDAKYNLARIIKIKREAAKKEGKKEEKKVESPQGWRYAPGHRGDNP